MIARPMKGQGFDERREMAPKRINLHRKIRSWKNCANPFRRSELADTNRNLVVLSRRTRLQVEKSQQLPSSLTTVRTSTKFFRALFWHIWLSMVASIVVALGSTRYELSVRTNDYPALEDYCIVLVSDLWTPLHSKLSITQDQPFLYDLAVSKRTQ
jgi:hypothetical protein